MGFHAALKYGKTEEGGRKTLVFKMGYRLQIRLPLSEMLTSGPQTFIDKEGV